MFPQPLYNPSRVNPAFKLRYTWFGWPTSGYNLRWPVGFLDQIKPSWESDGLRLLESHVETTEVRLLFSALPVVSPVYIAARAKGRLAYAMRTSGIKGEFSRKLAVRSIGDNTTAEVQNYISQQVVAEKFVDPKFSEQLQSCTIDFPDVD